MSAPPADGPPAPSGRGRLWQGLLGVVISVAFLVWAMWDVKPAEIVHHLRNAEPGWYLASVLIATLTFPLRTIRWRILLRSSAGEVRFKPLWDATAIGFMANNVLPARAGELVRSYAGTALVGVPFSTALASVAVERVFDGVVIVGLLALGLADPAFPAGTTLGTTGLNALVGSMSLLFGVALVVLIALVRNRARAMPVIERLVHRLTPARLATKLTSVLHHLADGFGVFHSTADLLKVTAWTIVQWTVNTAAFVTAFWAFHLDVPASAGLVLQGVVAFGVAIPQAPGFFGVFEGLAKLVLVPYGVRESEAVSFALGTHIGWFLPITLIGLVILGRTGLSLKALRTGPGAEGAGAS